MRAVRAVRAVRVKVRVVGRRSVVVRRERRACCESPCKGGGREPLTTRVHHPRPPPASAAVVQVFCFTPRGDVISLPRGSTPLDFAYAIHSNLGNRFHVARVNGHSIRIDAPLRNGDLVEVVTRADQACNRPWPRPSPWSGAGHHIVTHLVIYGAVASSRSIDP